MRHRLEWTIGVLFPHRPDLCRLIRKFKRLAPIVPLELMNRRVADDRHPRNSQTVGHHRPVHGLGEQYLGAKDRIQHFVDWPSWVNKIEPVAFTKRGPHPPHPTRPNRKTRE